MKPDPRALPTPTSPADGTMTSPMDGHNVLAVKHGDPGGLGMLLRPVDFAPQMQIGATKAAHFTTAFVVRRDESEPPVHGK